MVNFLYQRPAFPNLITTQNKKNIRKGKQKQQDDVETNNNRQKLSVSPEPPSGYSRKQRELLEDMDEEQYKLFHVCNVIIYK